VKSRRAYEKCHSEKPLILTFRYWNFLGKYLFPLIKQKYEGNYLVTAHLVVAVALLRGRGRRSPLPPLKELIVFFRRTSCLHRRSIAQGRRGSGRTVERRVRVVDLGHQQAHPARRGQTGAVQVLTFGAPSVCVCVRERERERRVKYKREGETLGIPLR